MKINKGIIALSPLLVFVVVYLVTSIIAGDFYAVPIPVAFLITSIYSLSVSKGSIEQRISIFSKGAGSTDIMLMIWIFILAGAFASSAKEMGCIDEFVNLTLHLLPANMIYAGLFLASCLISLSIGTSVGTIVALSPIAAGISQSIGADTAFTVAIISGGAFFGDNLSFISDTTIVATSTQGCRMSDKFYVNSLTTIPVALIIFSLYILLGNDVAYINTIENIQYIKVLPYLLVLVLAVMGLNVAALLTLGLVFTALTGILTGSYDLFGWISSMGKGITEMSELIIVTILAGGLLESIRMNGGIDYIVEKISKLIKGKRSAELSIGSLVGLVNVCTANHTIAILTVGNIAKKIGDRWGVDNRKSASILDTFSCGVQGLLPYGAQILIAAGLANVNPVEIVSHMYYPAALLIISVIAITIRYPRKYS